MTGNTLTTFEIAKYCNVTHRTVRQWILDGKLKSYRTPGNHSRVSAEDFVNFLKKYHMPIPTELLSYKKNRVLVVDDDKGLVLMIKELLRRNGDFEIDTAYDGFSAGIRFAEFKPDIVTLDIRMPKMNGLEVLKQIRENPKNNFVKVIIISGFTEDDEKKSAIQLGANALFEKPFKSSELLAKVHELLQ